MKVRRLRSRRALLGIGLGAALAAAAVGAWALVSPGGLPTAEQLPGAEEVDVSATLSPRIVLFGDTLTARVEATVDRTRVDPESVRLTQDFAPWAAVTRPVRTRRDSGAVSDLAWTYVLRCVVSPCVPPRETAPLDFNPAKLTYRARQGRASVRRSATAPWPELVVHSRLVASDFRQRTAVSAPWKADVTLPPPSYTVAPALAEGLMVGAAALLCLIGVALVALGVPRRRPAPEPEPEPEPVPALAPLEQALLLLESEETEEADQRRALELVAEEMALRADRQLERTAKALAWSEDVPSLGETRGLAALVRAALEAEESARRAEEAAKAELEREGDAAPA